MKIAFDVKGTLSGYHQEKVRRLFKALQDAGHEMIIWSNSYSYAHDMAKELQPLGLIGEPQDKYMKSDEERYGGLMDIAIEDDTSQTWLGTKRLLFVHELPDDVETLAKELSK